MPPAQDVGQRVYLWLTALFVNAIVLANVVGVKLFSFDTPLRLGDGSTFRVEHTVGMLVFPLTFLITDLLNEFYGPQAARRVTYVGFTMAACAYGVLWLARVAPPLEGIPGTASQAAIDEVFGSASVMYLASITAFLIGSLLDIAVFHVFKRITGGRYVWLRTTGSTAISQVFDSLLVTFLFFWLLPVLRGQEHADFGFVIVTAAAGYVLKFVLAVLLTPAVYLGRWGMTRFFGLRPVSVKPMGDQSDSAPL